MNKISILIADDHKLIRESWAYMLNDHPSFSVIAECGDTEQALKLATEHSPDIIIMDINMPPNSGIEATETICKKLPGSKIIGLSMHAQPVYAKKMMKKGAMGYITKNSPTEEMFTAIFEVFNGKKYICDEIRILMAEQLHTGNENKPDINKLSFREIEICDYIRRGFSSKEIATDLNISYKTVEVHRQNILKKLGITNSVALVNLINRAREYTGDI